MSFFVAGRLDVGDPARIERRRLLGVQFIVVHDRSPSPIPFALPDFARIAIVRMTLSAFGLASSIVNSPFSISAPVTSIPSASTTARRNCRAAMQELFRRGLRLFAANDELAAFDRDVEFFATKACDSERNEQFLFFGLLDVVRRIAVGCGFGGALEQTLKVLKTEQERTVEIDGTVHIQSPPSSGFGSVGPRKRATRFSNPGKGRYLLLTMWGAAGPNQGLGKCCQNWRLPGENTLCSVRLCNSRARTLMHLGQPLRPWSASEFLALGAERRISSPPTCRVVRASRAATN